MKAQADRWLRRGQSLVSWPGRGSLRARSIVLAVGLVAIGCIAWLIAERVWRDELPRSTIAAAALVAVVLVVLWLFGSSGWKTALGILSALGAILIAAGTALDLDQTLPDGPAPIGALVDCPDFPDDSRAHGYVASTELGYIGVRPQPSLDSTVVVKYPIGCRLAFDGYCIGEPKDDWRFDVQDPVWFSLASGKGYVPGADIRSGPAEGGGAFLDCPGGEPRPRPPEITAPRGRRLTGAVRIAAASPRAVQVGFAVYYPEVAGRPHSASWHQIGVDLNTGDGITADWDSRSVPGQGEHRPAWVSLLAVPCLGLEFPAKDVDQRTYLVDNGGGLVPPRVSSPGSPSISTARHMACDNVDR
jgi:hypothetical protein